MQSIDGLALVIAVLSRKTIELCNTELLELRKMVPERAGLGCAPTRARDRVPAIGRWLARHAGARIDVHHSQDFEFRKVDVRTIGRWKRYGGQLEASEMTGGAIVPRHRDIGREHCRIVSGR